MQQRSYARLLHTYQARAPWPILEGPHVQIEHGYIPQGRAAIAILSMALQVPDDFPHELLWELLTELGSRSFAQGTNHPRFETAIADVPSAAARILRDRQT